MYSGWDDDSVLEAASWRLASELARRHPEDTRLARTHPAGGQADCLTVFAAPGRPGEILLNRNGTIQVPTRFDGQTAAWEPTSWDDYLRADPREFVNRLEIASGLPVPAAVPPATPRTLTLRVLATLTAAAVKSVHPIEIESGMIDTSGDGAGPYSAGFEAFRQIPTALLEPRADDLFGIADYRFWFVVRDDVPVLACEQDRGLAWTPHREEPFDLMAMYVASRRHLLVTTLELLCSVDQV